MCDFFYLFATVSSWHMVSFDKVDGERNGWPMMASFFLQDEIILEQWSVWVERCLAEPCKIKSNMFTGSQWY